MPSASENTPNPTDEQTAQWSPWMDAAIAEARAAATHGDVPIGCVVVKEGKIVGRGHNRREADNDPTAHAEIIALRDASATLGAWRLSGCTLVVTCEPCAMCAGALVLARVDMLVYGCTDPKAGACESLYTIPSDKRLNHRMQILSGIKGESCGNLLREFFRQRRL
ncbi:MAG: tRNA adenosine(34) deaminase TadA [Nitrospirota bacterium]|nr:tRNA adenosine(34) deaminase TadA [Nitrospirota bacterium]